LHSGNFAEKALLDASESDVLANLSYMGIQTVRTGLIVGLAALALGLLLAACVSSVEKPKLEPLLRALGKNQPAAALQRLPFQADLGLGQRDYELVYLHVEATEPNPGPPIVLIHGTPSTLLSWTELIYGSTKPGTEFEGLAASHEVYAIEIIGHGIAPGDAAPYGFERCARFIGAALEALGLEQVHLVGSSYGGEFAWRAALNEPDRFASLTLLDSSGVRRRDDDWLSEEVLMRENGLAKLGWILNSRDRIRSALAPHFREIPPDRVEEFFLVCQNSHNWKAMVDLACDENGDRESELPKLKTPTLLLWGEEDLAYSVDYYGQRFAEAIPNSQFVKIENTGHYPHEESPARVVRELLQFFRTLAMER